jgi:chorismate dehydratase
MNTDAVAKSYKGLRLGVVPYLNVKPLVWNIDTLAPGLKVVAAVPRELTTMLDGGQVNAGIIPTAAHFHHPAYRIVRGISIACEGEARSVVLLSKKPINQIGSVLLDRSSLTSIALLRVLLHDHFRISPTLTLSRELLSAPYLSEHDSCDAFLIIGNAAMQAQEPSHRLFSSWSIHYQYCYDLGEAWHQLTGLPFVFALWAVGENQNLRGLDSELARSKQEGLAHLADIARTESHNLDLPESVCYEYLSRNMKYDLSERELQGIRRFQELLAAQELCPPRSELKFYPE